MRGVVSAPSSAADASIVSFATALEQIAARATALDAQPRFPTENIDSLRAAGVLQFAGERARCGLSEEISLVRAVARSDGSTARILDGHFNAVERVSLAADGELRERELDAVRRGELLLGVWGADPAPDEGIPASIETDAHGSPVLRGVKTFCSGAGGVQRALVLAREPSGARRVAYIDTGSGLQIDRSWYRASGLRASESHRVEFRNTPIIALLGGADELTREPYFSRDAVRTAATWAGLSDSIFDATVAELRAMEPDDVRAHGVGRMQVARSAIDCWLEHAAIELGEPVLSSAPATVAIECRVAIAQAAREIAGLAAQLCGSRALISGAVLDRARRDVDLFLLQHRLDARLVGLGRAAIEGDCK
jgi:alkylation response protein AidB-like acyl-CoA dehydrogenase